MIHDYLQKKIDDSKDVLRLAAEMSKEYYHKPLIITYSGGKDSDVCVQLARECLDASDFEVLNSHTTLDAPETVYYIRKKFKELEEKGIHTSIHYPRYKDGRFKSMWSLIVDHGTPPTRIIRYCCEELKETTTPNRFIATGVRSAESSGRRGRDVFGTRGETKSDAYYYYYSHVKEVFEDDKTRRTKGGVESPNEEGVYDCMFISKAKRNEDLICQPIYKWTDSEVWEFIRERNMEYNPLYDQGFLRVGCIGCPLAGNQVFELEKYPKYKQNYIRTFQKMLEKRIADGKHSKLDNLWKDGESIYKWWIGDSSIEGQTNIFDFIDKEE